MPDDPLLDRLRASTPRGLGAAVRIKTTGTAYGYVDIDAADRPGAIAVLRQLGFRDAPRVSGFNPSGRHLRQDATGRR